MIADETDLDALFKRLHLANARRVWRGLIDRAERERWAYRDFLTLLATEEIAHRQQTRLARLTRRAHFPFLKTIDDFNFTYQSSLRLQMLGSALSADFVTEGRSLILAGKPGRGKTHLAVAVAYRAIQNGFDAFFTTAAALIDDLSAAFRAGELAQALPTYTHPAVLVVDEVGYLTYGTDAANMLFHVVNERHRRHRPMIFTTNKSLKAWGRVLHDEDLAHAIIDRVLERGRLLRLDGPSVRTLHVNLDDAMKEESDQQTDLVRISGKSRSEFPEPTLRATLLRSCFQALMREALNRRFDVVLAESLDRFSRDQEDTAGLFKRLAFAGGHIVTLPEGDITHLHIGFKGTMNALFLKDLAEKTHRGLRGRIEDGKTAGGLCYGYRVVKALNAGAVTTGEREIAPIEAAIVQRIFREFIAGVSPKQIAKNLNREGVPGPFGGAWSPSTIYGNATRGTGILNNELYVGRLVWNRLRYVKNPDTGKRVSLLNPTSEWMSREVAELRIVPNDLWTAAKSRQKQTRRAMKAAGAIGVAKRP